MPHAIITCCDSKHGDFLIEHWLRSLEAHGNLRGGDVDVIVLDYGMTPAQVERLQAKAVRIRPCMRDGHLTNIRYRDIAAALRESNYDQVLSVDGGDVIFQDDIRPAFEQHKDRFRAVCEPFDAGMHVTFIGAADFHKESVEEILRFLGDRPAINGGVVFGPATQFVALWDEFQRHCHSFTHYASDQLLMSYLLYRSGVVLLDEGYNFALYCITRKFRVHNGVFLDAQGRPIPIVHNNGQWDAMRMVSNFGFGQDRNRVRWVLKKTLNWSQTLYKAIRRVPRLWRRAN